MLPRAISNENVPILSPQRRSQPSSKSGPPLLSSPAVTSSHKRQRVAETLREAQQMEVKGNARAAVKLYEDAYRIVPDSSIAAKLSSVQKVAAAASRRPLHNIENKTVKTPTRVIASDADILSATIAAFSAKKPRLRAPLGDISTSSNEMTSSTNEIALKKPLKVITEPAPSVEPSQEEQQDGQGDVSIPMEAPGYDEEEEETQAAAPVRAPRSRDSVARTLREKVAASIQYQLLDILNNGSLDELLELRLIGERRAQYIMELREEGTRFESLEDLEEIGMCDKQIRAFKYENLAMAVGAF